MRNQLELDLRVEIALLLIDLRDVARGRLGARRIVNRAGVNRQRVDNLRVAGLDLFHAVETQIGNQRALLDIVGQYAIGKSDPGRGEKAHLEDGLEVVVDDGRILGLADQLRDMDANRIGLDAL